MRGGAALRAAASEAALSADERAGRVVDGVRQAGGHEGKDEEVLEPEGHGLAEQRGKVNGDAGLGKELDRISWVEKAE